MSPIFKTVEPLKKRPLSKCGFKNCISVSSYLHKFCTEFDTHNLFRTLGHAKYEGYPEIKDKKQAGWEGTSPLEGWHHPTPSPDLTPRDFHLFLNLKEHLAGQKYHEDKEVEKQSHYMVARAGGGVLRHRNKNTHTQATQMPWQMRWLCWKTAKYIC